MERRRILGVVVGLAGPAAAVVMTTLFHHLSGMAQGAIYAGLVLTTVAGLYLILWPGSIGQGATAKKPPPT